MTSFNAQIEGQLKAMVRSFKLQFDFAVAADMSKEQDALEFVKKNNSTAKTLINVMQTLGMTLKPGLNDADILDNIAKYAAQNNSATAQDLKSIAIKVRNVNSEMMSIAIAKSKLGEKPTAKDMNAVFKKHLSR